MFAYGRCLVVQPVGFAKTSQDITSLYSWNSSGLKSYSFIGAGGLQSEDESIGLVARNG